MKGPVHCAEQLIGCKTRLSHVALATHVTSSPMRGATCWDAKRNIATVSAMKNDTPTTSPTSRAMAPEKCHFPRQIKR